jgi:hypothetical protein
MDCRSSRPLLVAARAALCLFLAVAVPASAQTVQFYVDDTGQVHGDWQKVVECASKPLPAYPVGPDATSLYRRMEVEWNQISLCRYLLIGFNAGWQAAGTSKPSPVQLVPAVNSDIDMRTPYSAPVTPPPPR